MRACRGANRAGGGLARRARAVIGFGDFFLRAGECFGLSSPRGICGGGEIGSSVLLDLPVFWSQVLDRVLNFRF